MTELLNSLLLASSTYQEYLSRLFERRRVRNPSYSLRAFARDLELSVSRMSEILSHNKGISGSAAERLCKALSLNSIETRFFLLLVRAWHGRTPKIRDSASQELLVIARQERQKVLHTRVLSERKVSWLHPALQKCLEPFPDGLTLEELASSLKVGEPTVQQILRRLLRHGLVVVSSEGKVKLSSSAEDFEFQVQFDDWLEHLKAVERNSEENVLQHEVVFVNADAELQRRLEETLIEQRKELEKIIAEHVQQNPSTGTARSLCALTLHMSKPIL